PDAADPQILHVPVTAGFDRLVLVEIGAGAVRGNALVAGVDPGAGTVTLDRPVAGIDVSTSVIVETIAYALDLFEAGRLIAQYLDLSTVPGHPRYGPRLLTQPWLGLDVAHPEDPRLRAPEPDLAAEYFRTGGNRGSVTPPLVVIRELRNGAARNALRPLTEVRRADGTAIDVSTDQRFTVAPVLLEGGADGLAALRVADFVGSPVPPTASAEVLAAGRRGLATLEMVDEISILAVPDIHIQPRPDNPIDLPPRCAPQGCLPADAQPAVPSTVPIGDTPPRFALDDIYAVQSAMVAQCERRRDRVALLDAPLETCSRLTFAASELRAWRSRFDTKFAALYAPWLLVVDPLRGRAAQALTRAVPPSGHVAGQCAALDLRSGVHLAPANVPLAWAQDVSLGVGDALHGLLNSIGVNAIRPQAGRGLRVLGARTVSSDSDWRFLNVRRLISMIEKSIDVSIQWAVFEPNDWRTRAKLTLAIQSLLIGLWQRGAMVGAVAAEAFFVRCDDTNNPPELRARGQLQIDVGVAPSVPFEFVVLRIGRDANGFTINAGEPSPAAS
ncbi:MAG TPA: phage tail sheath C-terminal domain-containing protein, partial [Vicinamibacterales bacterium]